MNDVPGWVGVVIAAASLLVTAGNLVGIAVLRYSLAQNQLENAKLKNELVGTIETRDKEVLERVERIAASFGEVVTGIREHINIITTELQKQIHTSELHIRDHFVRRGVVETLEKDVRELRDLIQKAVRDLRE